MSKRQPSGKRKYKKASASNGRSSGARHAATASKTAQKAAQAVEEQAAAAAAEAFREETPAPETEPEKDAAASGELSAAKDSATPKDDDAPAEMTDAPAEMTDAPAEMTDAPAEDAPAPAAEDAAPAEKEETKPEETAQEEAEPQEAEPEKGGPEEPDTQSTEEAPGTESTDGAAEADEEEKRRLAEMTRTVQVSVEQILARMEAGDETPPDDAGAEQEDPEPAPRSLGARIGLGVLSGLWGIVKWLLLVVLFVAVIAGGGVWWLYQGATADLLPQITADFGGQTLTATSYDWHVPVVNDFITRRYQLEPEEGAEEYPALAEPITGAHPQLTVSPAGYDTALTILDAEGGEVFSGTVQEFGRFRLDGMGEYKADLIVSDERERFGGDAAVLGRQEYKFTFTISVRPTIRFDSDSVKQGDVLACIVAGVPEDDIPTLETAIDNAGFVPTSIGWVAYLPIAADQQPGEYSVRVHTKEYVDDATFTVKEQIWEDRDYSGKSQLISPYLGLADTPAEVKNVLNVHDDTIYWAEEGFCEPFARSVTVRLGYGTTEYVGRSAAQREAGTGSGRISTNTVISGHRGEKLSAPAAGRVLLAAELEGTGGTVVIEHGGGVKSIFYRLDSVDVSTGDMVSQGDQVGTADGHYIIEARVASVPVDPLNIWRGQCNAMRCY